MLLFKDKQKLTPYKKPQFSKSTLARYPDGNIPPGVRADLAARLARWETNNEAQQLRKERLLSLKLPKATQDLMDVMYRFCAGPGEFGSPTNRPLLWTGSINIHYCQNFWISDICLYMTYPFVTPELFSVIAGLHEIFKRLLKLPVDQAALLEYRPEMLKTLKSFQDNIPANYHGILVHGISHIYDLIALTGAAAILLTMYIFERLVALYNRIINDRRDPETNLAHNLDSRNDLLRQVHESGDFQAQLDAVPQNVKRSLGVDAFFQTVIIHTPSLFLIYTHKHILIITRSLNHLAGKCGERRRQQQHNPSQEAQGHDSCLRLRSACSFG